MENKEQKINENEKLQDNTQTPAQKQKVAVIVGASSGIGHHTAVKLLNKGYKVYNFSRTENKNPAIINILTDVEKTASINSAFNQFAALENAVDLFIYSAGYSMAAPVQYVKMKDVTKLFNINYFGAVKCTQKIIPLLRNNNGGKIIYISSMASILPIAFDSYYSSSKAALDMLAKSLSIELEPYNIKVISAMPGGTATRFTYKRNVYNEDTAGEYYVKLSKSVRALEKTEQEGMLPSEVASEIVSLSLSQNPPTRCALGLMNKTYKLMHKVLPEKLMDYLNSQQYN